MSARRWQERPVLITGGAGFIGTNLARRLLDSGVPVRVFDNFARAGVEQNRRFLTERYPRLIEYRQGDLRCREEVAAAVAGARAVFHLAAQVAVTTSLDDPLADFAVNALGTLYLLEALRALDEPPPLIFTSTNKVYGSLPDLELRQAGQRYQPVDPEVRRHGIGRAPLEFYSPYGCSKGAADQYVLDFARVFNLPTVVFRMSCIYGPHQFGTEDQGWVAHFLIQALDGQPLTLYGDGRQVRDVLFVDDLVSAFLLAWRKIDTLRGRAFNVGGGPANTISLLELIDRIEEIAGQRPALRFGPWRRGDQRYYVSDVRELQEATGWRPQVSVADGVRRLYDWLASSRQPWPLAAAGGAA